MPRQYSAALGRLVSALTLGLLVSGCHDHARVTVLQADSRDAALPASCGRLATLQTALSAELMRGGAPEASPMGQCTANAARNGSVAAAMLLAGIYGQAMSAVEGAGDARTIRSAPALRLDLFGRRIAWLHIAAQQGSAAAQLLLAQETDGAAYRDMSGTTLAWYQTAAENGNEAALTAIGSAYRKGRIRREQLYDLKVWLSRQTNSGFAGRQMLQLLARPEGTTPFNLPKS